MGRRIRTSEGQTGGTPASGAQPPAETSAALGFAWRLHKSGDVTITRAGRAVTVLRGDAARAFEARVAGMAPDAQQTAMAKATGRYKRGNERLASRHARNR